MTILKYLPENPPYHSMCCGLQHCNLPPSFGCGDIRGHTTCRSGGLKTNRLHSGVSHVFSNVNDDANVADVDLLFVVVTGTAVGDTALLLLEAAACRPVLLINDVVGFLSKDRNT